MQKSLLKAKIGIVLITLTMLFLPIGSIRPNRVSRGLPLFARDLLGPTGAVIAVALILALALYAFKNEIARAATWLTVLMPALLTTALARASTVILTNAASNGPAPVSQTAIRISFGIGFWLCLTGIVLIQSTLRRPGTALLISLALLLIPPAAGWTPQLALFKEYQNIRTTFSAELLRHLLLALSSAAVSILPGIILGYRCHRDPRAREWILGFVNLFQVAPTLSLLGLIMIPLTALSVRFPLLSDLGIRGIGFAPAFIVLILYCLLPITANAYAGFDQIEEDIVLSASAMGMTPRDIFRRVQLPLALPIIISGIRTAVTQNLGNTILAGLIGGGGMGALIFLGLSQSASDLVVLGTFPVVILALLSDSAFKLLEEHLEKTYGVAHDPAQARS